jgi:hypothetical protein
VYNPAGLIPVSNSTNYVDTGALTFLYGYSSLHRLPMMRKA